MPAELWIVVITVQQAEHAVMIVKNGACKLAIEVGLCRGVLILQLIGFFARTTY